MVHGFDPLVEISVQHLAPHGDVCLIFTWEGEYRRIHNLQNRVFTNTQHKYMYTQINKQNAIKNNHTNEITMVQ